MSLDSKGAYGEWRAVFLSNIQGLVESAHQSEQTSTISPNRASCKIMFSTGTAMLVDSVFPNVRSKTLWEMGRP